MPSRPVEPPPPAERRFEIPGQGDLLVPLPAGWTESQLEQDPGTPPTFQLEPGDGAFLLLVTPLWNPDDPEAPARLEQARALVEYARREMAAAALEAELPLVELAGDGARGYWFQATDRTLAGKPKPAGEWLHVLQGAVAVGRLVVAFTLLDDADGPHRRLVLDAMRAARQEPPEEEEGDEEEDEQARVLADEPLSVALPGRSWSVLLDLPGFAAQPPHPGEDGRGVLALAADTRSNAVASVLVVEREGVGSASGCREHDLAHVRAAFRIRELRTWEVGVVARARYVVPEMDGRKVNQLDLHAWRFRDGACVAVHLSLMDHRPGDEAVLERIAATLRLAESF
ncbi:MAG TPA: hypothetical protein VLS93_02650 [Anaeromyxobacteraceae bacterium]|nr:hypothetical protein [Anaeromyxobacteraceae bacterium]